MKRTLLSEVARPLFLMMIIALTIPVTNIVAAASQYVDVRDTHWAREAIEAMSERGIIAGYPDHTFQPEAEITYGEFIKMAVVAVTGEVETPSKEGNWAGKYYDEAVKNSFFTVHDIASYQLERQIPRGDMALIISSILGEAPIKKYDEILNRLEDVNHTTKCEFGIVKSVEYGILTGYPDNTFRPEKVLTRAEAAIVIQRLVLLKETTATDEKQQAQLPKVKGTKERLQSGSHSEFANWVESSVSKQPIADVLSNAAEMRALESVKYYEIVEDYPHSFSFEIDLLGGELLKASNLDYSRGAILIKDKAGILLGCTSQHYYVANSAYDAAFPRDFDYIGFYNNGLDVMMLVPNPFK